MDLFGNEEIRALSWKEPFATLMLHGKIETRTWKTSYRGLVLICASKKPYGAKKIHEISGRFQTKRIFDLFNSEGINEQYGKAIAIGRLSGCRPMQPIDRYKCFVEYDPKKFCHIYTDVKAIKPFEWNGYQGWKKITQELTQQILKVKGYPKQILSKEFKELKRALEKLNECAGKGEISLQVFETRLTNITTKLKQLIEVITLIMTDKEIELYLLPVAEFSKFEKEVLTTLEIIEL